MEALLTSIYDTQQAAAINIANFGMATGVSLALGMVIAVTYMYKTRFTEASTTQGQHQADKNPFTSHYPILRIL